MPAIMSHHQFGIAVLAKQGAGSFPTRAQRDAFLLGNQGPDPFFFAIRRAAFSKLSHFGVLLHTTQVEMSLSLMLNAITQAAPAERSLLEAYISGYLCHIALDSYAHPYIFALSRSYCSAGVQGLDKRDEGCVHSQIEADIDSYLIWRFLGKTVADIRVTRYALQGNNQVLDSINGLFVPLALRCYGINLPKDLYSRSVHDMRLIYDLIQSPTGRKRALLGMAERALPTRRHSKLQTLAHRFDVYEEDTFMNLKHDSWQDPFDETQRSESFLELFEVAVDAANVRIEALLKGQSDARALTGGKNLHGKSYE